jgi:hypothetical protein
MDPNCKGYFWFEAEGDGWEARLGPVEHGFTLFGFTFARWREKQTFIFTLNPETPLTFVQTNGDQIRPCLPGESFPFDFGSIPNFGQTYVRKEGPEYAYHDKGYKDGYLRVKAFGETLSGSTSFGTDLEAGGPNEVPEWVVDLDEKLFAGGLAELFGIEMVPAPDVRRGTRGAYRFVATGAGAQRWRGAKAFLSRPLTSTIPEVARLAGTTQPKAGLEPLWARLGDLLLNPAPIESAFMLERRAEANLEQSIQDDTAARRARKR